MTRAVQLIAAGCLAAAALTARVDLAAQTGMPNPKEMSGKVRPVDDLPSGTVSIRVVRGAFQNLPDQPVLFMIGETRRTVRTDAEGRAQVSGLAAGTRLRAEATIDGEKLETEEIVIGGTGVRVLLVATDPETAAREAEDKKLAASTAVKGTVVLGPETRIITQLDNDRFHIYYILHIINSARVPVDIGGPLVFDLPREARSATILQDSSPQASANGPRVIVTGPFAPGATVVQAAYELPYPRGRVRIDQVVPANLAQFNVLVQQIGGVQVSSPQFATQRDASSQGESVIIGNGGPIPAGQAFTLEISGLPYRAQWPRQTALGLAAVIVLAGVWGAVTARPLRRR